ncbi:hypothetical protein D3C78_1794320 [compost metagenome]
MLLASEAPDCIEAMAINSRPMGNNVAARLRGWTFIVEGCSLYIDRRARSMVEAYDAQSVKIEQYSAHFSFI